VAIVQTVLGPIDPGAMGPTLSHVHLTLDILCWYAEPQDPALRALAARPLSLENLGLARRNGLMVRDNLVQNDEALAIREVAEFKRAGGGTLVDMELPGIGRDVAALQRIGRATGLHIIASSGWYTQASHPPLVARSGIDELAETIVREIEQGIDGTDVRAGNIGEVGLSGMPDQPFQPDEEKVLRAAARAQAHTGASLTLHPNAGTHASRARPVNHLNLYLDVLEKEGADLAKVYVSHMGFFSFDDARSLLERGLGYVSYDHFGHEEYYEMIGPGRAFPRDKEEVDLVMRLVEAGHADRVLIGNEIGWKTCYKAYGGWGYGHVLEHIVPWLRDCGASDAQIRTMLVANPARLHAIEP
jgi:phosphotriesterase-related protein